MKIEDYETAQALMDEKEELMLLEKIFNKADFFELYSLDFHEKFDSSILSTKSKEELQDLIRDFCARRYREIDEEISKL